MRDRRVAVSARAVVLAAAAFAAGGESACAEAPVVRPRVVAIHPHDPDAFTQGLAIVDGVLYESTGLYGRSTVRRVDLETGRPTRVVRLDDRQFGEGLAVALGRVYQLTWRAGVGFVRDPALLAEVARFAYEGEGWGLAWDGERLVMSDGTDVLRFLDPRSLEVVAELAVRDGEEPVAALNELEVVDGIIYANVWRTTRIARIDPSTGELLDWIELADLVPPAAGDVRPGVANGIAYEAATGRLLVTGKLWPRLYEIEVAPPP